MDWPIVALASVVWLIAGWRIRGAFCDPGDERRKDGGLTFEGFFSDFEFEHYTATHKSKGLCFWVCNGFDSFRDWQGVYGAPSQPFIRGLSQPEKKRLWDEYVREVHRRSEQLAVSADNEPVSARRIAKATRSDVEDLFRVYGFRDELGHDLLLCEDFQGLLDIAKGKQ